MTYEQIRKETPEIETKATSSTTSFITLGNGIAADTLLAHSPCMRFSINAGFQLV
jgi:hypothetical protein